MEKTNDRLWRDGARDELYGGDTIAYQAAILEQYKLYVEMSDRISQRRAVTNTFFLTLNTAIFSMFGLFWKNRPHGETWWLMFPLVMLIGQCFSWFYLLRSYRLLNSAKYAVVGALEARLPASPYWNAEWTALGAGTDPKKYWPLSHIESWIPLFFALLYVAGFAVLFVLKKN